MMSHSLFAKLAVNGAADEVGLAMLAQSATS